MEKKEYAPTVAAWEKPTSNGGVYLSVKLRDGSWINLFKNGYKKEGSKEPDWKELPPKKKESDEQAPF
jgi:uncharacterized protein (DUF736 family)